MNLKIGDLGIIESDSGLINKIVNLGSSFFYFVFYGKKFKYYKYPHCFIVFNDYLAYEASGSGRVKLTKYDFNKKKYHLFRPIKVDDAIKSHVIIEDIKNNLGKKYGYLQLLGILWVAIIKFFTGRSVKNPLKKDDVCAEKFAEIVLSLSKEYLELCDKFFKKNQNLVSCIELFKLCNENRSFFEKLN